MADGLPQLTDEELEICAKAERGEITRREAFRLMRVKIPDKKDYLVSPEVISSLDLVYVGFHPFREEPIQGVELLESDYISGRVLSTRRLELSELSDLCIFAGIMEEYDDKLGYFPTPVFSFGIPENTREHPDKEVETYQGLLIHSVENNIMRLKSYFSSRVDVRDGSASIYAGQGDHIYTVKFDPVKFDPNKQLFFMRSPNGRIYRDGVINLRFDESWNSPEERMPEFALVYDNLKELKNSSYWAICTSRNGVMKKYNQHLL